MVDLETAVVHQPRPRSLDDPAARKDLEDAGVDALHPLG